MQVNKEVDSGEICRIANKAVCSDVSSGEASVYAKERDRIDDAFYTFVFGFIAVNLVLLAWLSIGRVVAYGICVLGGMVTDVVDYIGCLTGNPLYLNRQWMRHFDMEQVTWSVVIVIGGFIGRILFDLFWENRCRRNRAEQFHAS